ncbi:hydrogenase nickel incorporation protein HypB [Schinkia azotoformans]|uniref:hydrogenase nickel incorporation protein HypB n=1 Tax=Schinkia azotoformans TaxID=1454 RepID=UPI002DBC7250|nr:hydrogenase nickel incorporation protein HypB [Schinkia azotoformans]MEC1697558.1 hydrogenase nickel incorporation protein HypB [Schinkia azotoformans]MEC1717780.1 hydrogenase nickel incorporation protein HypB [Schinkia azotoformans]MEC1727374.1 hydrogenase nickel incorporation protein HypB [Schinkia azotoformans]MEC1740690.1 hydrogenase nickel incorporation protein HypB [Schinkia azotoformans]MEC1746390.1 hydrogenase nickel incorporation protein HypB [Schinkia azotoformans]
MKVILGEDVLVDNNTAAAFNREQFVKNNILVINLMSSPGAGKTTLLQKTVARLSDEFRIGVIEGDLATEIDANRIREAGAQAVQINTGGGCHLDARMIAKTLPQFDLEHFDILFIENVGNLVCPSGYDLGQNHKIAILSVPEGNDKIPKYPVMFRRTEMVVLNKIDLLPYLDFSVEQAIEDLKGINPDSSLMKVSARTDEGMDQWINWIRSAYQQCQRQS